MGDATRKCPECAETILAAAKLCRHCGARFDGKDAPAPPPKKSGAPIVIILVCVLGGGFVLVAILAALLLPAIARATYRARVTSCANNLSQLWKMQNVYMSQFGGRMRSMPPETGEAFWLYLEKTNPPLIDASVRDIYECPLRDTHGTCDYRGPAVPVNRMGDGDVVGADKPENHEGKGGNVLRKSGDVIELDARDFSSVSGTLKP